MSNQNSNPSHAQWRTRAAVCLLLISATTGGGPWPVRSTNAADDAADRFFEMEVRPILVEQCVQCHGVKKQEGELRLDSREGMLAGGDRGAAIVPGKSQQSRLVQAIRHQGDLEMPPDKKLTDRQVGALVRWIDLGAPWPATAAPLAPIQDDVAKTHWAFQPVKQPAIPAVASSTWPRNPIDAFVLARLRNAQLSPSPEADRRTLIRRTSYAVRGLPPSQEEVVRFVNDPHPRAFQHLVDRLLASPQFGQHWARHWLDVARYSDTKGYVYAREERFWVHAWTYRDWVVEALNRDVPYNRFLLLQLAGDQVPALPRRDLAAMGFLTLGRRFLGVKHEIIDDRIDVVCRGTMGLTVGCARCHDHKYDPIPTADYYALYGVFDSCSERLVPLEAEDTGTDAYQVGLAKRQEKLRTTLAARRRESSERVRQRLGDYLRAQQELEKYPPAGFDQVFQKSDMLPAFVRRWAAYLHEAGLRDDPVFVAWHRFAALDAAQFADQAAAVSRQLQSCAPDSINPLVQRAFVEPPASFADVIDRYAGLLRDVDQQWKKRQASTTTAATQLPDPHAEQLRQVLYGPQAPCEVPNEPIVHSETYFDSASCTELWKLQGEVDRWIIRSQTQSPYALTLIDRQTPSRPRVFRRGKPTQPGDEVPRRFLSLLNRSPDQTFRNGSGRLELAQRIIDPANPLTARVIVNRVWARYFGKGLVKTPSDFGIRAGSPSHPELLDWLAARFIDQGWSLKQLHRAILLSATYRQASTGPDDPQHRQRAAALDPDNRLLWHMNARRLTFEEFRDSLLASTGELDLSAGGKPVSLFDDPLPRRRTLYGLVDRQFLPGTLRVFDFANPDLHVPQRPETTVPQQALFFLNHPLVLDRARQLARGTKTATDPRQRARQLFERCWNRKPDKVELTEALQLVGAAAKPATDGPPATAADWQYGYGTVDESAGQVAGFKRLPHFTGGAWQGGAKWPDTALGWLQLTATGGHPGNTRQHAVIRRWTAPRAMTVGIDSLLQHEPAAGDGIRAMIVSAPAGILLSEKVHQRSLPMNVESVAVKAGQSIDFVVDIDKVLNSDQYLWTVKIKELGGAAVWNSQTDFPKSAAAQLGPWEQLAHVLLCANEFVFVD